LDWEDVIGLIFKDPIHDEFATWALSFASHGGAEVGEVVAIATAAGDDADDGAFFAAWSAMADRLAAEGATALAQGRRWSARECLLHAACYYAMAYHPLFGEPVDPRLRAAFGKQMAAFDKAMELFDPPVERLSIPFEGRVLPGYLIRAEGAGTATRPLLVATNGYDASMTEMFFGIGVAAARRGYHCLLFDGPGQGKPLIEDGLHLRPDWETVVAAVLDVALGLPGVDPTRVAIEGWSLGGYLAPRAASGEPRLAACIADPGSWGIRSGMRGLGIALGLGEAAAEALPAADEATLRHMTQAIEADRKLRWSVVQRGYWVHGVGTLSEYLHAAVEFTLEGRVEKIRCPTLMTAAERDPLARGAQALFEALTCPKELLRFTAAEGAGEHCEILNRSLLHRRVFGWLDSVLQP